MMIFLPLFKGGDSCPTLSRGLGVLCILSGLVKLLQGLFSAIDCLCVRACVCVCVCVCVLSCCCFLRKGDL